MAKLKTRNGDTQFTLQSQMPDAPPAVHSRTSGVGDRLKRNDDRKRDGVAVKDSGTDTARG